MAAGNVVETIIGAVVLVAAAGFAAFAANTANFDGGRADRYTLEAKFRKADGVSVGTEVRIAGVRVGSVTGLNLDPLTYQAVVDLRIDDEIEIPEDSDARVESDGLLGGAFVSITPGASEFMLVEGDEIINTQGAVSLLDLIVRFGTSLSE